jgi:hypothetical protein
MMTKWDTIQADIADAYVHLDEEESANVADVFGFADAIEIDHLSDAQVDDLLEMLDNL